MYSNGFVSTIIVNGKHLKELANGQVPIAFGSTYSIWLQNKNPRRAQAKVWIDEELVGNFIVDANSGWNLERHADKNVAFLFVKPDSQEAKSSKKDKVAKPSQGVIRIQWSLEVTPQPVKKYRKLVHPPIDQPCPYPWGPQVPWKKPDIWVNTQQTSGMAGYIYNTADTNVIRKCSFDAEPQYAAGVTAEGGRTLQEFDEIEFNPESSYTELRLVLVGYEGPVEDHIYCIKCGRKRARDNVRYCWGCGSKL